MTHPDTMKKASSVLPALMLLLGACAPQAELVRTQADMSDIRGDARSTKTRVQEMQKRIDQDAQAVQGLNKRLEALDANVKATMDVQKVMADYGAKSDQLGTDIHLLQGKIEENNYRIAEFGQKLDDRNVKIAELSNRVEALETKIKALSAAVAAAQSMPTPTAAEKEKTPAVKTIEPTEAYRQAKSDFDKGNIDLALAGFQNYVAQFPDTSQTDKAQYWIGECLYSKKDFPKAIEAFTRVISTYPKSDKIAGAKLKIGLSYLNEKNTAKAKEFFGRVVKEHPGTNEAEIAKDRLAKIR